MVGDVAGAERQLGRIGVASLSLLGGDFRVLYDTKLAAPASDHPNRFSWACLGYNFGGTVRLFLDAVSQKNWIGNTDKAIVDAVGVNIENLALGEIGKDSC